MLKRFFACGVFLMLGLGHAAQAESSKRVLWCSTDAMTGPQGRRFVITEYYDRAGKRKALKGRIYLTISNSAGTYDMVETRTGYKGSNAKGQFVELSISEYPGENSVAIGHISVIEVIKYGTAAIPTTVERNIGLICGKKK